MKKRFRIIICLILAISLTFTSLAFAGADAEAEREGDLPEKGFTLNPTSLTVPVFSGYFGVRIRAYMDGELQNPFHITWSSSNSYVASVDNVGCVYASSTGTTTITARAQNGSTATCSVTVVSNSNYPNVNSLNFTQITELSYQDRQVGIGILFGGEPVIIRRYRPRGAGMLIDNPGSNPNADNGWTFTYAKGFRFTAAAGHNYTISVERYAGEQDDDVEVFLSVYNSNYDLIAWDYSQRAGEYPSLDLHTTSAGNYYVVLSPVYQANNWANGYVQFSVIDPDHPLTVWDMGDVNHDGRVDIVDALTVLRHAMGLISIPEDAQPQADVDGDGRITITDALLIMRFAMGLIGSL